MTPHHSTPTALPTDPLADKATLARVEHVLLVFLDGVGIGVRDARRNPFFSPAMPFLREALGTMPSLRMREVDGPLALCLPADARLGVKGLPQSGTGQTALYTGRNAARLIGRHFGPYVYSSLKPVIEEHNIFGRLRDDGVPEMQLALANAFPQRFFDYLAGPRRRMVAGMMMAMHERVRFRTIEALHRGDAVSTDITAARWREIGHPDAPVHTPAEAGRNLARITMRNAFTLFEYFQTDLVGHERDHDASRRVLADVDALLRGTIAHVDTARTLVVVTSDHGNLEDLSTKTHTRNPVPVIVFGDARHAFARDLTSTSPATGISPATSISHLTPAIRRFLARTSH